MNFWPGFPNPQAPQAPQNLQGFGFSAKIPPGFGVAADPMYGGNYVWPPGAWGPPNSPALIWLVPVMHLQFGMIEQQYRSFDNPWVAAQNAQTLGLAQVLRVAPLRETTFNGAAALVREFDAVSFNGQPLRFSAMLLRGPASMLQCIVGINLYRWVEFAGPALQFVSTLQLAGTHASPGEVRTVVDTNDLSRVEMQVGTPGHAATIMNMPTSVGGTVVYHIHMEGGDLRFGDVKGTNVQIGDHNTNNALGTPAPQ